jgi:hypothetical protein
MSRRTYEKVMVGAIEITNDFSQPIKTLEQTSMIYSEGRKVRENMMCGREFISKKKIMKSKLR